jgi:SAM-dependent methyltransferase
MESNWNAVAKLRRDQIETGKDLTFSRVFVPLYSSLIAALNPSAILEVGIGTGHLALEISKFVTHYVGVDPSGAMIGEATDVLKGTNVELVQARVEDFRTNETFDVVLSHMCLQTVGETQTFLSSIARLLHRGGIYIIAIPHPAFFNDYKKLVPIEKFSYMGQFGTEVDFSITLDPNRIIQQVPYFHRPLSQYFTEFSRVGLSVLYLNEIFPSAEIQELYGAPWTTPRYLVLSGSQHEFSADEKNESLSYRLVQYR